ncbi:MAG: type I methionyl aminopeptidase [Phycisphaerales bacterium]|nr:type I methionyl aminopeptidase [Phycisphaerales bacterium]
MIRSVPSRIELNDATRRSMSIAIRSSADIEGIAACGQVVAEALEAGRRLCVPGCSTGEISSAVASVLADRNAQPLFIGLASEDNANAPAFPAAACVSVDEEVIHGIPGDRRLGGGELVKIDCGARLDGWCADAAITVPVGETASARLELIKATETVLETAVELIRPGRRWSDIARILQDLALDAGYGVLDDFTGHGIGRELHEFPAVPSHLTRGLNGRGDFTLRRGMVLAIEPILVLVGSVSGAAVRGDGTACGVPVEVAADGWTVRTVDAAVSAHFEHTVAVGRSGATILTTPGVDVTTDPIADPAIN